MLVQALPLMLVFFLLVPRVQGPLWGMPKDASAAVSGLAEEMSPGSIGSLALSDAIAFRAEFDDKIPPGRALYWRAIVMNEFDGQTWRAVRPTSRSSPLDPRRQRADDLPGYAEPHNRPWYLRSICRRDAPQGTRLTGNYQLLSISVAAGTLRIKFALTTAGADATPES